MTARLSLAALFVLGFAVAAPVGAQVHAPASAVGADEPRAADAAAQARLRAQGEAYHRAPDSAQDPDELVRTRILNAEVAAANQAAAGQERDDAALHAEAMASYREEQARAATARAQHEEAVRAAEAARARYDEMYAAWQAQVRACEAGDRRACAAGPARRDPPLRY